MPSGTPATDPREAIVNDLIAKRQGKPKAKAGRPPRFTMAQKADLVEEYERTMETGASVSSFFKRRGVTAAEIYEWAQQFKGEGFPTETMRKSAQEVFVESTKFKVPGDKAGGTVPKDPQAFSGGLGTGLNNLLTVNKTLHAAMEKIAKILVDTQTAVRKGKR